MKRYAKAGLAAAAGLLYAESEYEKKHFTIVKYRVRTDLLDSAWNGYRMVFLSDLHGNIFGKGNIRLKQAIEEIKPDAVLIGGDMMIVKPWKKMDFSALEDLLCWLCGRYPVYYANGNHESRMQEDLSGYPGWYEEFCRVLERTGAVYLSDGRAVIRKGEKSLYVYGLNLDEAYYNKGKKRPMKEGYIRSHIGDAGEEGFHLLLAHSPIYLEEYAAWGADLILSGHFHGGTIRLPGIGGVMSPQFQFFSRYNRDTAYADSVPMIISAGLGTHSVNVRLNNPPQIVVLELKTGFSVYRTKKI